MATRTDRLRVEQDSTDVRAEGYLIRLVEHLDDTGRIIQSTPSAALLK